MRHLLLILILTQSAQQFGIITVERGQSKQIGYIAIHGDKLWVKFDYKSAEEFNIMFTEPRGYGTGYYVKNERANGLIEISEKIYFNLILNKSGRYNKIFIKKP